MTPAPFLVDTPITITVMTDTERKLQELSFIWLVGCYEGAQADKVLARIDELFKEVENQKTS